MVSVEANKSGTKTIEDLDKELAKMGILDEVKKVFAEAKAGAEAEAKKAVPNTAKALTKALRRHGVPKSFFTKKRTKSRMNNFKEGLACLHPDNRAMARRLYLGVR